MDLDTIETKYAYSYTAASVQRIEYYVKGRNSTIVLGIESGDIMIALYIVIVLSKNQEDAIVYPMLAGLEYTVFWIFA